jgi:hypothetical protein
VTSTGWCRTTDRGFDTRLPCAGFILSHPGLVVKLAMGPVRQLVGPVCLAHWTRMWDPAISQLDPPVWCIGPACGIRPSVGGTRLPGPLDLPYAVDWLVGPASGTRVGWWDQMKFANLNGHIDGHINMTRR